jgi:protein-ribulosamine 3-kinase
MSQPAAVDPAILTALGLSDASAVKVSGGASGTACLCITVPATESVEEKKYFVKTSRSKERDVMLKGERESLAALSSAVAHLCPRPLGYGPLSSSAGYFLAMEYLSVGHSFSPDKGFAEKLTALHTTARSPDGMYGFHVPTCCGSTEQDNAWTASWCEFFTERRLRPILAAVKASCGPDPALEALAEDVIAHVVPRLLSHLTTTTAPPVLVHGDLWIGNYSRGWFPGREACEDLVYDGSCVYAHSEYELGIMRFWGGFGDVFWDEYHQRVPKTEPAEEYDGRIKLYQL